MEDGGRKGVRMLTQKMLTNRHIRLFTGEAWIPVRKPANIPYLKKLDGRIKPYAVYYTQGRFFNAHKLRGKKDKDSFFWYQDYIIVDVDEWTPDAVLRMADGAVYSMFTGRGFHFCLLRPRFENEQVMNPRIREERAYFNNAILLKKIAEEKQVDIDLLPSPRQLFKLPHVFYHGNRFCKVWWGPEVPSKGELMNLIPVEKNGKGPKNRAEKGPGPLGPFLLWTNNVIGTRCFVLFAYVSRSRAMRILERYNLSGVYFDNDMPYLMSLDTMNRERVAKILRKEGGGLKAFEKYGFLQGICEGDVEILSLREPKGWSRGHIGWLRFKGLDIPIGTVGERFVKMKLGRVKNAQVAE